MPLSKKITMAMTEAVLIQVSFLNAGSKQKQQQWTSGIPWHLYNIQRSDLLKTREYVSFLFGTWTLVLFSHVWVKPRFLLLTLTWQTSLTLNFCIKTLNELCVSNKVNLQFVYKNVIAVLHFVIKTFQLAVSFIEELIDLRFSVLQQFLSRLPRISSR